MLPVASASTTLPPGTTVDSITIAPNRVLATQLNSPLAWGEYPRRPNQPPPPPAEPDPDIYNSPAPWPPLDTPLWRIDTANNHNLLTLQLHPIRYSPAEQRLLAASSLDITIHLKPLPQPQHHIAPLSTSPLAELGPGLATYVILSTAELIHNTPPPWNFQALCNKRTADGHTTAQVTLEWLNQNYTGANLPAKIRRFVQDAHHYWGCKFLLLGGTHNLIPTQHLYVSIPGFFGATTANIPSDAVYYGCIDGEFDYNNNGLYGEPGDGTDGAEVDLIAEVLVGRFPVANSTELANMVRKTLRYESATPTDLAPHAFVSEKVNFGSMVYATGFLDELRNGSTTYGKNTLGFNNSPFAPHSNADLLLYDSDSYIFKAPDALAFLNQNLHTINHVGHGSTWICFKISLQNNNYLNALHAFTNTMPWFVYSQACDSGAFDRINCFGEEIVTTTNAAFATIMNSREGWEYANVVGGYSHMFNRAFWDTALRGNATRLGEINELSKLEQLHLVNPKSPTYWRWVYYGLNLLGDPATPFAASINPTPPQITHTPLINTYNTTTPYTISCTLDPIGIYDPDSIMLVWSATPQSELTTTIHTQQMHHLTANHFETQIPPQPAKTRVEYTIIANNHAGCTTAWPPDHHHTYYVTERLTLNILGSPDNLGNTTPPYGSYHFASGLVATASSPQLHYINPNTRYDNRGYFGTGSTPQTDSTPTATFRMDTTSYLIWHWQLQHALTLDFSTATGLPSQTIWADYNTPYQVPAAPEFITISNTTTLAFAQWQLDGNRFPAAPAPSTCIPDEITATTPTHLKAIYLPIDLDQDNNGLADWWELRYFGTTDNDPNSDPDDDGITNLEEFLDRTNPLDSLSTPAPPIISHTPLASPRNHPGPYTITATITDTHTVINPELLWHQGTGAWQSTPMLPLSNNLYHTSFAHNSLPGDDYAYLIRASDPAGRQTQTPLYYIDLVYPVADTSRLHDLFHIASPNQPLVTTRMNLHNTGNAELHWSAQIARLENFDSPALIGWDFTSLDQPWTISTNRFLSPPHALHASPSSGGMSTSPPVRATITLPSLRLAPGATLSFDYWIHSEIDRDPTRAFDGGLVEYSLDNGKTFNLLRGPYTHTFYGWKYSPWEEGTPCFAGHTSNGWQHAAFDLLHEYPEENGFANREVTFRLHYAGDNNTDLEGWYIDNLAVAPLALREGYYTEISPQPANSIPPGLNRQILWHNSPLETTRTDDLVTIIIQSNDPATPLFTFDWHFRVLQLPPHNYPETTLNFIHYGTSSLISWHATAGYLYTLETTTSLTNPEWEPLPGYTSMPGQDSPINVWLPYLGPTRFFRLLIHQP